MHQFASETPTTPRSFDVQLMLLDAKDNLQSFQFKAWPLA
jgi:hypothetical protein